MKLTQSKTIFKCPQTLFTISFPSEIFDFDEFELEEIEENE